MRCLIVDDSDTSRQLLRGLLAREARGASVQEAHDATVALDLFRRERFDLVFLDMLMAGENGLDVLARLRRANPEARVVLVTALSFSHPDVVAALRAGTFGALPKPVSAERLRDVLARVDAREVGGEPS